MQIDPDLTSTSLRPLLRGIVLFSWFWIVLLLSVVGGVVVGYFLF